MYFASHLASLMLHECSWLVCLSSFSSVHVMTIFISRVVMPRHVLELLSCELSNHHFKSHAGGNIYSYILLNRVLQKITRKEDRCEIYLHEVDTTYVLCSACFFGGNKRGITSNTLRVWVQNDYCCVKSVSRYRYFPTSLLCYVKSLYQKYMYLSKSEHQCTKPLSIQSLIGMCNTKKNCKMVDRVSWIE